MQIRLRHLALAAIIGALPVPVAAQGEEAGATTLSVVAGSVVDHATGAPIADAVIELTPRGAGVAVERRRLSAADGAFRFDDVAPGDYVFRVNALGYATAEDVLDIAAQSDVRVVVRLTVSAIELQPIVVETTRRPAFMDGFEERRAAAGVHSGFFTSDEIMALEPKYVTDVARGVPGTNVVELSSLINGDLLRFDGDIAAPRRCLPNVFVNGVLVTENETRQYGGRYLGGGVSEIHEVAVGLPVNDLYEPEDVAAIEIYSIDSEVPPRFRTFRDVPSLLFDDPNKAGKCGALVIWLKEGAQGRQFASTWKRLLGGLAVAAALLLLMN
ncbi:MAG: carboxypeptidase-like regulatory domain-containing protein [Gemmatimonadota bacterium]